LGGIRKYQEVLPSMVKGLFSQILRTEKARKVLCVDFIPHVTFALLFFFLIQILNNVNGHLDAKRTCAVALKLHRKYLKKVIGCG